MNNCFKDVVNCLEIESSFNLLINELRAVGFPCAALVLLLFVATKDGFLLVLGGGLFIVETATAAAATAASSAFVFSSAIRRSNSFFDLFNNSLISELVESRFFSAKPSIS